MELFIEFVVSVLRPLGITETVLQFMLVSGILGLSIYLTLYTGMFSLANAGFMAIGAYIGVILTQHFDQPLLGGVIGGMLAAGLVAIPIGLPVLRLRDIYLAIATIGFGEIVRILVLNFDDIVASIQTTIAGERVRFELLNGARGIKNIPKLTETSHLIIFLIILGFLMIRLHRSRFGRAMAAIRQDENAAATMGINVVYVKNVVFVLSAMLAGAAGAFNGHLTRIVVPDAFGFDKAVDILAYAVLGGTSTWIGPIIGGMALSALPEVLRFLKEYRGVFNGLVLLVVIVYLPDGLVNGRWWSRMWGRFTARFRVARSVPSAASDAGAAAAPLDKGAAAALELGQVSRYFGGLQALDRVDMVVPPGRIVGLIGPNGAGKTTLINNISGLDHPTSGTIHFDGRAIHSTGPHRITGLGIARTYQNIRLFGDLTTLQNLLVGQHSQGRASLLESIIFWPRYWAEEKRLHRTAVELLERFGLLEAAGTYAANLPYGDQRRLEIARALATGPRLLLLDEPTAGMNPTETRALGEQILRLREDRLSVLVIEHDMSLIHQVCDEVYVLNFGQIIAHGTPDEIKNNPLVIEAYLGKDEDDGTA